MTTGRVVRPAGRILVVDPDGACLLAHVDSAAGPWLFTPGGGCHPGELPRQAARRELAEETSIVVDRLLGPVLHRRAHFTFLDRLIEAHETFWVAHVAARPTPVAADLDDYEHDVLGDWRWLSADDLRRHGTTVYPRCLPDLLDAVRGVGNAPDPVIVGRPWSEAETADGLVVDVTPTSPPWASVAEQLTPDQTTAPRSWHPGDSPH